MLSEKFNYENVFRKFTSRRKTRNGFCVKCKKGLWRVEAPTKEQAEKEGRHYFAQYFTDGEYVSGVTGD